MSQIQSSLALGGPTAVELTAAERERLRVMVEDEFETSMERLLKQQVPSIRRTGRICIPFIGARREGTGRERQENGEHGRW